ncbi:MAG: chromate transporter [Parabacteroides sp.]|jgi:chromate transporter|uniref:Chromate transporter n=3 Tax=root TaxID=1 RepID=A0A1T5A5E2_9BACT|nr:MULTISPECIES: chromate transporter [Bacteroidales]MBP7871374.1 chromate transporter [Parabacteroides sp.]MDT3367292.1 chromate transporter [Bacteroidota bacterium]OCW92473.1 chromate transporter [Macellibacteroides sp. HH-ZS]HAD01609.1 chromate transporter [Porphyromonadaceae bacterium]MBP7939067.1 chromate transporter [Parabacteroides sp.]
MYWTLFITFVRIGAFTIGGGYAMLPLIQREVVDRGWMSKEEFIDLFAVAQSLPGVFAVNISIFVGYKLKKLTGSVICALGTILPSFLIILAIALFFTQFRENEWVEKAFKGLRPAVVALIAVPVITTARSLRLRGWVLVIPVVVALSIWLLSLSPVYIIIVAAAGGLYYRMYLKRH